MRSVAKGGYSGWDPARGGAVSGRAAGSGPAGAAQGAVAGVLPGANGLARLQGILPQLKAAERRVADVLLAQPDDVVRISITELAERSQVSEATVVRLSRKLGFSGFQELKIRIAQDLVTPVQQIHEDVLPTDDAATVRSKVFGATAAALASTEKVVEVEALEAAATAIHGATEVVFFAVGLSAWVAADAAQRFTKLGLVAQALHDGHAQATKAALLRPGSVAVGVSHSGSTRETVRSLELARGCGATTICITSFGRSPITRFADIHLFTSARETAFRTEAMSSRVAQIAIVDTLFVLVALKRYDQAVRNIARVREVNADKRF